MSIFIRNIPNPETGQDLANPDSGFVIYKETNYQGRIQRDTLNTGSAHINPDISGIESSLVIDETGQPVIEETPLEPFPITSFNRLSTKLIEGWNIIAYTGTVPVNATLYFKLLFGLPATATDQELNEAGLQIAKNNAAEVYWPEYGFNGIGNLIPGQGYQVRVRTGFSVPETSVIIPGDPETFIEYRNAVNSIDIRNGYSLSLGWNLIGFPRFLEQDMRFGLYRRH